MGIFKRRSRSERDGELAHDADGTEVDDGAEAGSAATAPEGADDVLVAGRGRRERPRDRSEVDEDDAEAYIDLGAVWVRGVDGMQLQLEVDEAQQAVTAINVMLGASAVQLQAFAAPRSGGLWREIRDEIANGVVAGGGSADIVAGAFGDELEAHLPQPASAGGTVLVPVRFVGIDGPRWFVRAVVSGAAASGDEEDTRAIDEVVESLVITRGAEAMAPRELLPLTMPRQPDESAMSLEEQDGPGRAGDLNPFERGPEITEVR